MIAVVALLALALAAGPAAAADTPEANVLYRDGPDGRHLLDGAWLYRADPEEAGIARGFHRGRATEGWRRVRVPSAFNARDFSRQSFDGSVGWYRKDFRVPDTERALRWAFRFESVNYRARVWLNGRALGAHEGAYLPFELPARAIRRQGINRLVVRVDSRRLGTDVPPRHALWWNWGGILREVYLRRVGSLDMEDVQVVPELRARNRRARVAVRVEVRNRTGKPRGGLRGVLLGPGLGAGEELRFPARIVPARSSLTLEAVITLDRPALWWPRRPRLYRLRLEAGPHQRPDQAWSMHFGVRSIRRTRSGDVLLNGRPLQLRGAGLHEDSLRNGAALTQRERAETIRHLKQLGANFTRAHYPLHPRTLELCDRNGIVVWDQIPFYHLFPDAVSEESVRREGLTQLREMIVRDRNHASVLAYSIGNELGAPGEALEDYIRRATRLARALDPSRLVALDIAIAGPAPRQPVYAELDALGLNEYYGWYWGTPREQLGPSLDALRRTYPDLGLFVTEFGAEANRHGAVSEKGTFEFQADFLLDHLGVIDRKPYIGGALIWALREFAAAPGWSGGNPIPSPPFHRKGLVGLHGELKPAFERVAERYRRTPATRPR